MGHLNLNLTLAERMANRRAGNAHRNKLHGHAGTCGTSRVAWFTSMDELRRVWRVEGLASELARMDHTGWYTDDMQHGLCRGIVARLPARNGESVFVAGFECTEWGAVCIFPETFDDAADAARMADEHARCYAEECREDDARFQLEARAEFIRERQAEGLAEVRALRAELANVETCGHLLATATIRERIRAIVAELRDNADELETMSA